MTAAGCRFRDSCPVPDPSEALCDVIHQVMAIPFVSRFRNEEVTMKFPPENATIVGLLYPRHLVIQASDVVNGDEVLAVGADEVGGFGLVVIDLLPTLGEKFQALRPGDVFAFFS